MKHLKTKLMASVAMLMVATVMISSASFAWFTISTAPEISGIENSVAANGNLEIALSSAADFGTLPDESGADLADGTGDAGKNITWGNLIDISGLVDDIELKPVAMSTAGAVTVPSFGQDGRIIEVKEAVSGWLANEGSGNYSDGGVTVFKDGEGDDANIWAYRVDFFMRSNVAGDVKLLETGVDRGAGEDGAGTSITSEDELNGITVAFQVTEPGDSATAGTLVSVYDAEDGFDFSNPIFTIGDDSINKIFKVSMYVYWDGASMTNADFENEAKSFALNVQFTHEKTLNGMSIEGDDDYSKASLTSSGT